MSFLGPTDLKSFLNTTIISDYKEGNIQQAAYELALGSEVYRTDAPDRKIEILDATNKTVDINPGQFTLLLTKETVTIPNDKLAFISIKAKHKLKGLVNVSGFHVDPGFSGKLIFSVYNAGPSTITLKTGERYFLLWFAELKTKASEEDTYGKPDNKHKNQDSIDLDYVDALKRGDLSSPSSLLQKIKDNESSLTNLKWAAGIIISLALLICGKIAWDNNSFKEGVEYGKKVQIDSIVKNSIRIYPKDSLTLRNIDSLIKQRIKVINDKNK